MPISSGGTHEKSSNAGKPEGVSVPKTKKLLSVAPSVLPLLPAVPKPPKLHQRSNTTLSGGVCGLTGEVDIKDNNKDRITLDRRGLTSLPVLAADAQVKLLSLQHNLITRLDNISTIGLSKLVFLDVYDNQLDRIAGLDSLPTLRVLLMGKNRIRRMEGLRNLMKLEVLDLHGNQISQVGGLSSLCELKVLNLAGNQIRSLGVADLQGLSSLQELNLRRNRLKRLQCFGETPQLQKLFLSNNEIQSIEDMSSVVKAAQIREVSVDGNPIALLGDCVSFLVSYLPNLELLSQVQVSDQVRKAALAWRANKEQTSAMFSHLSAGITLEEETKREEVICNARTNWELLRSQTTKQLLSKHSSSLKDLRSENIIAPEDQLPLSARAVHLPERAEARRITYSKKRTVSQQVTEQVRKAAMVWKANREKTIEREEAITNAREKWETLKCSEVAKSQLSSSLRELRFEEIIPLNQSLPLSGKAVQLPQRAKRNIFSKRKNHSQVQEAEPLPPSHTEPVEFFRLPPILAPLLQKGEREAGESVSSVEPVADSSLSSLPDESTSESDTGKGESHCSRKEEREAGESVSSAEPVVDSSLSSLPDESESDTGKEPVADSSLSSLPDESTSESDTGKGESHCSRKEERKAGESLSSVEPVVDSSLSSLPDESTSESDTGKGESHCSRKEDREAGESVSSVEPVADSSLSSLPDESTSESDTGKGESHCSRKEERKAGESLSSVEPVVDSSLSSLPDESTSESDTGKAEIRRRERHGRVYPVADSSLSSLPDESTSESDTGKAEIRRRERHGRVYPVADSSLSSLPDESTSESDTGKGGEKGMGEFIQWQTALSAHYLTRALVKVTLAKVSHTAAEIRRRERHGRVYPVADSSLSSLPDESTSESDTGKGASSKKGSRSSSVSQRKQILTQRTTGSRPKPKPPPNPGKVREQGGDYLVEISGRYLNVYGQGALRFIDRPWNPVKAGDVTHVRFNYVNFNSLSCVLGRLKQRFPNAEHYSFRETNIHCMGQLNALADIQGLTSLTINEEGNPITGKEWRSYAIYRLSHWGLRVINDQEIKVEDISVATQEYNGLSELVLWSLPDSLLQPLLSRLRLETTQQSARHWLWAADPALRTVVAKEALQWRRTNLSQEDMLWRHKGKNYLGTLLDQACSAIVKLRMLDQQWPTILRELVRDTLVDYSTLDAYMKQCMNNLKL
ncbi:uncharacterized protein LOC128997528 [Macrosteles quadrilineatus]|uniref:uncharacterized protein LOC128997528 n=1 Tax=Macrosteles quadrilineatus TaxID=74068 RepID=UPI0023E3311D|nr:uncharacterized protein LOC128997528 [Macrosteles quadrilineatus]